MDRTAFYTAMLRNLDKAMALAVDLHNQHSGDTAMELMLQLLGVRESIEARALKHDPGFYIIPSDSDDLPVGS